MTAWPTSAPGGRTPGRVRLGAAACSATAVLVLTGCGSAVRRTTVTRTATTTATTSSPNSAGVLTVTPVGRFEARCRRGARRWTLRFVADRQINDFVSYRLARGPRRTVNLRPGQALTWQLRPGAFRSHEPGFRRVPGDPIARPTAPVVYLTTTPLNIAISQGSEPQILVLDARLTLAAALGGGATDCALVDSRWRALTYFNGGQPKVP